MKVNSHIKKSKLDIGIDIFIYCYLAYVIFITLYPFLNVLAVSLNDSVDTVRGASFIIPRKFTWNNYIEIFKYPNLVHAFGVSIARTLIGTVAGVVCSCMLAFTLSRQDYVFRKFISMLFVLTMYISGGLIPSFMLMRSLKLIGTFWVYIIPALVGPFYVILIRSFIDGIPYSLQECASIEGANDLTIFFRIIVPLCLPVIATVALYIAVGQWNSWFDTYLYNKAKPEYSTLQYELMKILQSSTASSAQSMAKLNENAVRTAVNTVSPQSIKMAITIVVTLPILLVYPFIQRYFVSGLTLGAVKS